MEELMIYFVDLFFTLISINLFSNNPTWALILLQSSVYRQLLGLNSYENVRMWGHQRRNGGNEARMAEPLTCCELMIKCNNH